MPDSPPWVPVIVVDGVYRPLQASCREDSSFGTAAETIPFTSSAATPGSGRMASAQDDHVDGRLQMRIIPDRGCSLLFPRAAPSRTGMSGGIPVRNSTDLILPAEPLRAMELILDAARRDDFPLAVSWADRLLITVLASSGPYHRSALAVAELRADLAWLSGDAHYATELWTLIARGWSLVAGPGSRQARFGARQAAAAWRAVPDAEASSRADRPFCRCC
ncbi:hypothetical protein ACFVYP_39555 [Kitasatospora sp. NPDC058201]|uniref:hypothetical protein n=1 Tax=unclassified Kitasatospora TaxID=2633591 RepID=UPI0036561877